MFSKSNLLKMSYNFSPVLQNRVVLYLFFFLTLADLFYLANVRDFTTVSIIILIGFLTSFFSKNMIVILCIALSVGHVLKYGTGNGTGREGAANMSESKESSVDDVKHETATEAPVTKHASKSDESTGAKKKAKDDLMKGLKEFQSVQGDLVSGIEKLKPMLDKAETFIEKYENYKNIN